MEKYKETLYRALRTFLQTAIGFIAANVGHIAFGGDPELLKRALIGLLVSAFSAGVAALMNLPGANKTQEVNDHGVS